jgi:chemotaxis-related protein WspD
VLLGIINVHGDLQLLVSLKKLLEIEDTRTPTPPIRKYARMMVIESDTGKWVFPVDEIMGTQSVHPGMFQNVPVTVAKSQSTYTKGIFHWNYVYVAFLDDELMLYSLTRSVQ